MDWCAERGSHDQQRDIQRSQRTISYSGFKETPALFGCFAFVASWLFHDWSEAIHPNNRRQTEKDNFSFQKLNLPFYRTNIGWPQLLDNKKQRDAIATILQPRKTMIEALTITQGSIKVPIMNSRVLYYNSQKLWYQIHFSFWITFFSSTNYILNEYSNKETTLEFGV